MRGSAPSDLGGLAVAALLGLILGTTPNEAAAEERCSSGDRAEADRHERQARRSMEDEPAEAARHLEAAHRLCPGAWYLGNLVVLYERLGRIGDAIRSIDEYLDLPDAAQRQEARAARQRLRAMRVTVRVETDPPGATVFLDGERLPGEATTPTRVEVDPGPHVLELHLDGFGLARREVDGAEGQEVSLAVALEPTGEESPPTRHAPPPRAFGEPEERAPRWTGGAQVGVGAMIPVATEQLQPFVAIGLDAGGGLDLGPARIELLADLWVSPAPDGYLLVASAGPRVGIPLGALPLVAEGAVLLGVGVVDVGIDGRQLPLGQYTSFAMVFGLALCYRVARWLEVVGRPARVELLGLSGGLPGGLSVRWGLDIGLRFRG